MGGSLESRGAVLMPHPDDGSMQRKPGVSTAGAGFLRLSHERRRQNATCGQCLAPPTRWPAPPGAARRRGNGHRDHQSDAMSALSPDSRGVITGLRLRTFTGQNCAPEPSSGGASSRPHRPPYRDSPCSRRSRRTIALEEMPPPVARRWFGRRSRRMLDGSATHPDRNTHPEARLLRCRARPTARPLTRASRTAGRAGRCRVTCRPRNVPHPRAADSLDNSPRQPMLLRVPADS